MVGSGRVRGITLAGAALLAAVTIGGSARAGNDHNEPPPPQPTYDTYTGPSFLRHIPGIRLLFGDFVPAQDPNGNLYGQKKKKNNFDESYYEPQPAPGPAKPKPLKPSAKPATATAPTASASSASASAAATSAMPQKTASAAPAKPLADGPLSCDKATEVVAGYGFSSVEASTCSGKLFTFNAKRDGKTFAIKLDPVSGELTEVRKLP